MYTYNICVRVVYNKQPNGDNCYFCCNYYYYYQRNCFLLNYKSLDLSFMPFGFSLKLSNLFK